MRKKIVHQDKCTGCKNCEIACIAAHLEAGKKISDIYINGIENAPKSRNKVEKDKNGKPFPQFCRHCNEPACMEACMSGAIYRDENGAVVCDTEKCVSCFMCVMSCPYGMAMPSSVKGGPMVKCDLCKDRDTMACAEACPTKCIEQVETDEKALEILMR